VTAGIAVPATSAVAGSSRIGRGNSGEHSYVALGDSFTSGPNIADQLGPDTNPVAPTACRRSSDNYPSLAARALGLILYDMSCVGATTADLLGSQGPGISPQLSALRRSTGLVTIGIGGNDVGFSSIAANCASATPWGGTRTGWNCISHYTAGGIDQLALAVSEAGARVLTSLEEIRARAPHARVFVIGYPDIVPPTGSGCWPRLPFSRHDVGYLNEVERELNATLAGDAATAGDVYVDMATPSASRNACTDDHTRWVAPITISAGRYPLHPSAAGMAAMAQIVEKAFTG
jgi:lysophospholipase L1-like esterase